MKKIILLILFISTFLMSNEIQRVTLSEGQSLVNLNNEKIFISTKKGDSVNKEKTISFLKEKICQFKEMKDYINENKKISSLMITDTTVVMSNLNNCDLSKKGNISQTKKVINGNGAKMLVGKTFYHVYMGSNFVGPVDIDSLKEGLIKDLCSEKGGADSINNGYKYTFIYLLPKSVVIGKVDTCEKKSEKVIASNEACSLKESKSLVDGFLSTMISCFKDNEDSEDICQESLKKKVSDEEIIKRKIIIDKSVIVNTLKIEDYKIKSINESESFIEVYNSTYGWKRNFNLKYSLVNNKCQLKIEEYNEYSETTKIINLFNNISEIIKGDFLK